MSLHPLRPRIQQLHLEGADPAVGQRHAVRVPLGRAARARIRRAGAVRPIPAAGRRRQGRRRKLDHHRASRPPSSRPQPLDPRRRRGPPSPLPRPGVRPARHGHCAGRRRQCASARPSTRIRTGSKRGWNASAATTTGSRSELGDDGWAAGERFTLADCAAAPALFYADWIEPIGPERPKLAAYRARLLAHPAVSQGGRAGTALPPLLPAGRTRPRLKPGVRRLAIQAKAGAVLSVCQASITPRSLASCVRSPPLRSG